MVFGIILTPDNRSKAYIQKLLSEKNVNISRLARGIPVGGNLEYVDEATLTRAINDRVEFND